MRHRELRRTYTPPRRHIALVADDVVAAAAVVDPVADELFWADGSHAGIQRGNDNLSPAPSPVSGLIEINCDGPLDRPFVGGQLVSDPRLRATYRPRVISSTLGLVWVAAGRRTTYISDGPLLHQNLHFAAGIAIARAAGCAVTDLAGKPVSRGRGLVVSADPATHENVLSLVRPHLLAIAAVE